MNPLIVLPTYNEIQNLRPMTEAILREVPHAKILVVDDHSPDGTGDLANQLALEYPQVVSVIHRDKKEGLGKAYLCGFEHALKTQASVIIQMDCDFSHPPSTIPQILKALETNDFVVASRYVSGGGVSNWSLSRRLLSRFGNLYARFILNSPIRDLTGGFKGFRRHVVEYLLNCPLDCSGYSFQIETSTYALGKGFRYVEIPFTFQERVHGVSKMSKAIVWEGMTKVFKLRKKFSAVPLSSLSEESS